MTGKGVKVKQKWVEELKQRKERDGGGRGVAYEAASQEVSDWKGVADERLGGVTRMWRRVKYVLIVPCFRESGRRRRRAGDMVMEGSR